MGYVDMDGWLTWLEATGGRSRARCHRHCHAYEGSDPKESKPSSQELLDEFLCEPDTVALVVSDHVYGSGGGLYRRASYDSQVEPALAVAIVCDAAGLVPRGTKVVCCTLAEWRGRGHMSHRDRWNVSHEIGNTSGKSAEVARRLMSVGVRVISLPKDWGTSEVGVAGWSPHEAKAVVQDVRNRWSGSTLGMPEVPILAEATGEVKKAVRMRSADQALAQRREATQRLRAVFRGFEAPLPRMVEALSFGLVDSKSVTPTSYKVAAWKRRLLEPSAQREESSCDGQSDRVAVAIGACAALWGVALRKYLIKPTSFKKATDDDEADFSEILEGWQQIGSALGVEDALTAVVRDGVSIEDVTSLI